MRLPVRVLLLFLLALAPASDDVSCEPHNTTQPSVSSGCDTHADRDKDRGKPSLLEPTDFSSNATSEPPPSPSSLTPDATSMLSSLSPISLIRETPTHTYDDANIANNCNVSINLDSVNDPALFNASQEKSAEQEEHLRNETDEELSVNDQFLSFEEWKKVKGVESNEQKAQDHQASRPSRQSSSGEAIGEEMEIDISNFFSPEEPEGRLYKDKFNFASFDCAATIVKTNSEAKGATSILFENKDSYLLNPCSAPNQFVIIELCQDILVDSVVMGNFEFFSSTFKKVRLSVSETFPVPANGWKVLAEVTAKDIRDVQSFNISNPMIWAKYIRVEVLEHYGNEYYCPLSLVRVHGRTMMQEYKQEEALQNSRAESIEMKPEQTVTGVDPNDTEKVECSPDSECAEPSYRTAESSLNDTFMDIDVDLRNNLTAWNDFEECAVTLPRLTLQELFYELQANESCETSTPSNTAMNTPSPNSNGGTQESIYKNIMKRLSALESNATLSVLYIEEQSKHISNAFNSLEKRHSKKLEGLMKTFNSTIHSQIEGLSNLYELVHTRTDEIFNRQREQHEMMLNDSDSRLDALASDLRFQRTINFINAAILFCLLLYIILTRETYIDTDWTPHNINDNGFSAARQRVVSKSRIRANIDNFKRYYYNSDGASTRSIAPSDEDEDSGRETPVSQGTGSSLPKVKTDMGLTTSVVPHIPKRPITPDHSDAD